MFVNYSSPLNHFPPSRWTSEYVSWIPGCQPAEVEDGGTQISAAHRDRVASIVWVDAAEVAMVEVLRAAMDRAVVEGSGAKDSEVQGVEGSAVEVLEEVTKDLDLAIWRDQEG